jgi:WD40 repeat protein
MKTPIIPIAFKILPLFSPLNSIQLLNHFQTLTPVVSVTQHLLSRLNTVVTMGSTSLELEFQILELLYSIYNNFTVLRVLQQQQYLSLFSEIIFILLEIDAKRKNSNHNEISRLLTIVYLYSDLLFKLDGGSIYSNNELLSKIVCWPTRFSEWKYSDDNIEENYLLYQSESDREYARIFYDIQMCTLKTISISLRKNPKLLPQFYSAQLSTQMEQMGLWVSVFFYNWKLSENETICATLRENTTPNLCLRVLYSSTPTSASTPNVATPSSTTSLDDEWFSRCPIPNHAPVHTLKSCSFTAPGFITKTMNDKYMSYWTIVREFLLLDSGADEFINFVFNFWRRPDTDAKRKLRSLSDFQFYFLDCIALIVSSTPHILEPLIEHGLYDILFSDYFYFYQIDQITKDSNLYSETATLQKLTSNILRDSVLSFIKYVATRGTSNTKEVRKLIEVLGCTRDPTIISEVASCLLDVVYHQMELTQNGMYELRAISIIAHVISALQSQIKTSMNQQQRRNTSIAASVVDDLLDSEIGSAITLNPFHTKLLHARNILLYILDTQICNEVNQIIAIEDPNTLMCIFTCLYDPHLSDFVLSHVKRLFNSSKSDDAANFESLTIRIVDIFQKFSSIDTASTEVTDEIEDSMQLVMRVLSAIQDGTTGPNRRYIQSQFRSKLGSIISILSVNGGVSRHELCIQVIRTLTCLLSENEKSKEYMRNVIGYDSLRELILLSENYCPSQDLFGELLNMLVDGNFDMQTRFNIANAGIIGTIVQLCQYCGDIFVASFLTQFKAIVEKCVHNRNVCCSVNLISLLLEMIPRWESNAATASEDALNSSRRRIFKLRKSSADGAALVITTLLIDLIQILGRHSITVAELKTFFALIKRQSDTSRMLLNTTANSNNSNTLQTLSDGNNNGNSQNNTTGVNSGKLLSLLLESLQKMITNEPQSFFDFDGMTSGITLPRIDSKIFTMSRGGYTVSFWMRLETLDQRQSPRLISLLSEDDHHHENGIEVYFGGQWLNVAVGKNIVTFDERFEIQTWYCITLCHVAVKGGFSFTQKSEIQLYVNGKLSKKATLKFLNSNQPLVKNMIGGRGMNHYYHGQMASIYLFSDALSSTTIRALYLIGPNYGNSFQPADRRLLTDYILVNKDMRDDVVEQSALLFDGSLTQKIVFCYNSSAQHEQSRSIRNNIPLTHYYKQYIHNNNTNVSQLISEAQTQLFSPDNSEGVHVVIRPAKLAPGTQLCVTHNISEMIGCLGGLKILFPLFLQIDHLASMSSPVSTTNSSPDDTLTYTQKQQLLQQQQQIMNFKSQSDSHYLVNSLLQLILYLLKDSHDNQEDMARCHGFQVIGFLLKQISPTHLTEQTVNMIPSLLARVKDHEILYTDVLQYMLFDFRLWIYAKCDVQKKFYSQLVKEVEQNRTSSGNRFRSVIGVQRIVDLMRWFYWFEKQADTDLILGTEKIMNSMNGSILGERPTQLHIVEIRVLLLRLLKAMIKSNTVQPVSTTTTADNKNKKRQNTLTTEIDDNDEQQLIFDRISSSELQSLLYFLADCRDKYQLIDMTQFVLELLLSNQGSTIADDMASLNAYEVFVNLLYVPSERVRILAIKCIGKLLLLNAPLRKKTCADQSHGFSLVTQLLSAYWFTEGTYRALRDVFIGKIFLTDQGSLFTMQQQTEDKSTTSKRKGKQHSSGSNHNSGVNVGSNEHDIPAALGCIFRLLPNCRLDVRQIILQDLKMLCEISDIQRVILEQDGWYSWILDLISQDIEYCEPTTDLLSDSDTDDVVLNISSELRMKLFTKCCEILLDIMALVLYYGLSDVRQGWKYLEDSFSHVFIYEQRGALTDGRSLISALLSRILDHYQIAYDRKTLVINFNDNKNKNSVVLENLLHFVTFVEEALFYTQTLNSQLANTGLLKKSDSNASLLSTGFGVIKNIVAQRDTSDNLSTISGTPSTPVSTSISFRVSPKPISRTASSSSMVSNSSATQQQQPHEHAEENQTTHMTQHLSTSMPDLQIHTPPKTTLSPVASSPNITGLTNADSSRSLKKNRVYDHESELNQRRDDETHQWLDLPIVQKVIYLLNGLKLASVANFNALNALGTIVQTSKRLRVGGSLRLTLRLIRYALRESGSIQIVHLDTIRIISRRDIESEKEIQRFKELWAVTGDLEEADDFTTRLLYILAFLFDSLGRNIEANNTEDAHKILQCIQELFSTRKKHLETKLLSEDKKPILKSSSVLFNYNSTVAANSISQQQKTQELDAFREITQTKQWAYAWKKYFVTAVRQVEEEEAQFLTQLVKRRQVVLNTVGTSRSNLYNLEIEFHKVQSQHLKQRIDVIRSAEHQRSLHQRSRYDEYDVIGSRLWKHIMQYVADDRGPWGKDQVDEANVKWKLDSTQNSRRMRLRLKRDYSGVDHADAPMRTKLEQQARDEEINNSNVISSSTSNKNGLLMIKGDMGSFLIPKLAIVKDHVSEQEPEQEKQDDETNAPPQSEEVVVQEKLLMEVYCEVVTPMQAYSGRMEITSKRILWYCDKVNQCAQFGVNEQVLRLLKKPKDKIWKLDMISEIHLRRYRLRNSAIEMFMTNSTNVFFNFKKEDRNSIYKKLISLKPPKLVLVHQISSPSENLQKAGITKMWVKGQLSNFDYLMALNTFAGRTYNDLSQYPVFPWIVQDFTSEELDLNNPKTYRNLSLPVGALNEDRHEMLQMRYETFIDPEIPQFHYGSHYSSAGIVLYFLVRMEPYTTYFRILQGGKFDHADRMFDSVPQTFNNCLTSSDYKELIPEFYNNGDFLRVHNNVDLGTKQNGRKLGDAILPPWAKGSVEEYIRLNRAALESDYVSENLHNWIDLIFGYKQRGPEAVKALNMFYYLTYEGTVDIDAIKDADIRRSTIAQIENFGQTPSQLFTTPHPKRMTKTSVPPAPSITDLQITSVKQVTNKPITSLKLLQNSSMSNCRLCAVTQDGMVYMNKLPFNSSPIATTVATTTSNNVTAINNANQLNLLLGGASPNNINSGNPVNSVIFASVNAAQAVLSDPTFLTNRSSIAFPLLLKDGTTSKQKQQKNQQQHLNQHSLELTTGQCYAIPQIVNKETDLTVYSCFHWDHSIRCSKPFAATNTYPPQRVSSCPQTAIWRHKDKVTCCTICECDEYLVTGSRDTTVIIWNVASSSTATIVHILYGHDDVVTCVAVNNDLDMVLSGSHDGSMIVHSLRGGNYIRSIRHPNDYPITLISISSVQQSYTVNGKLNTNLIPFSTGYRSTQVGNIIMYSARDSKLYLYNMNGTLLVDKHSPELITAMILWDNEYVIVGGEQGSVRVLTLHDLEVVKKYDLREFVKSRIRSLCISDDASCLFIGSEDGKLVTLFIQ